MSIFDRFRLTGKRLFITGGSCGLGREMALAIADAGADVILVGRDAPSLQKTAGDIRALGRQAETLQADVGKAEECEAACKTALERHGPIDILINNVGGRRENIATEEMPLETWQRLVDLNLTSAFVCTRMLGGAMIKRGWGRVINVASICAQIATRNIYGRHYETAKAALVGFTRAVAADWAPHGVTVNAIAPGGFLTDANRRWFRERPEFMKEFVAQVPMARLGEPEELGPLAVYLASEASRYMTGATLVIDGGFTLW